MNSYGGYDGGNDEGVDGGIVGGTPEQLETGKIRFYGIAGILCFVLVIFVIMLILYMIGAVIYNIRSMVGYPEDRYPFSAYKKLPFNGTLGRDPKYLSVSSSNFLGASDGGPAFWNMGDVDKTNEVLNAENDNLSGWALDRKMGKRDANGKLVQGLDDSEEFGTEISNNGGISAYGKSKKPDENIKYSASGPGKYYTFGGRNSRFPMDI